MNKEQIKKIVAAIAKGHQSYCAGKICEAGKEHGVFGHYAEELLKAGYINGTDFVEWLKKNLWYDSTTASYVITEDDLAESLQEYLKGE